jgi:DNA-directed RNA polymerase specialized sigma24 family protein
MTLQEKSRSHDVGVPTAECLLKRMAEIRGYLRRQGFSEHAIDHAMTILLRAAMPYIKGNKICTIENRRAWAFKVAIRAAVRAAKREIRLHAIEPAKLAATVIDTWPGEERLEISDALKRLTQRQSDAIQLCVFRELPLRVAAKEMKIAVRTLCGHLSAAKERLREILPKDIIALCSKHDDPGAVASYTAESGCTTDEEPA